MSTPNTHYTPAQLDAMLRGVDAVYFLGIGGISMSSLACMAQCAGLRVGGYDRVENAAVRRLRAAGILVDSVADAANLEGYGAVVYTVAIPADQPEYLAAQQRNLPLISRANYMGYLMRAYRSRIGISGTHGKSTTTGMLAQILLSADTDPTVLCGADIPSIGAPFCIGHGDILAFEACEYMDSFLDFYPTTAVVLNTELDHVDYFQNIEQMCHSYTRFCDRCGEGGTVIGNADDPQTAAILGRCVCRCVTFGIDAEATYRATGLRREPDGQSFSLVCRGEVLGRITLRVTGRHNVYNALAAAAAAREQGICLRAIRAGLAAFGGVGRRMEYRGMLGGARVYDDYAHHPTEIRASMEAARALGGGRLLCVFQSHTYSRTAALFDAFVAALSGADAVIVAPIYAAREQNDTGIDEQTIAAVLQKAGVVACAATDLTDTAAKLRQAVQEGDTVLVMGAGDIDRIYPLLAL